MTEIIFVSFEHNFSAYRENFLFTQSTSQRETYPVSWAHFSIGTKQNYLTWRNVFSLTEITSTHMNRPSNRQGNPEKTLAAQKNQLWKLETRDTKLRFSFFSDERHNFLAKEANYNQTVLLNPGREDILKNALCWIMQPLFIINNACEM